MRSWALNFEVHLARVRASKAVRHSSLGSERRKMTVDIARLFVIGLCVDDPLEMRGGCVSHGSR